MWGRVSTILEKSTLNPDDCPSQVVIPITTVRKLLGVNMLESLILAFVLHLNYSIGTAWLIPLFKLLQVGWIWDKAMFAWGKDEPLLTNSDTEDSVPPPSPFVSTVFPSNKPYTSSTFTGSIAPGYGLKVNPVVE